MLGRAENFLVLSALIGVLLFEALASARQSVSVPAQIRKIEQEKGKKSQHHPVIHNQAQSLSLSHLTTPLRLAWKHTSESELSPPPWKTSHQSGISHTSVTSGSAVFCAERNPQTTRLFKLPYQTRLLLNFQVNKEHKVQNKLYFPQKNVQQPEKEGCLSSRPSF